MPTQEGNKTTVFLYEFYSSRQALEAHMKSPRLAATRGSYDDMITARRVVCRELA